MKIAIDIQPLLGEKSGIGYYGESIIRELQKQRGNALSLQFFSIKRNKEKLENIRKKYFAENTKIKCARFSMRLYLLITALIPLPRKLFFRCNADISFFFNFVCPPFAEGKKVLVVHDMVIKDCADTVSKNNRFVLKTQLKRSIKRADLIVTISNFSRDRIIKFFPEASGKIVVIPCAVDHERFRPIRDKSVISAAKNKYKIDGEYFLYLGTLEPRKNILRLIEAYFELTKRRFDCPKLVIAGGKGWLYESIFARAGELNLSKKIIFTGYLDEGDVTPIICGAAAFCFPSLYEGFGLPVLEAMACGTPVITSNCSSLPEVGGDACIYVNPHDTAEISDAMERIFSDEELRNRLSEKGILRAGGFNWTHIAGLLGEEFHKLSEDEKL